MPDSRINSLKSRATLTARYRKYSWVWIGKFFSGALQDHFHVNLGHLFPDLPVDDLAAATVHEAAKNVKGTVDVDVGGGQVPVLMRLERLKKSRFLSGSSSCSTWRAIPPFTALARW